MNTQRAVDPTYETKPICKTKEISDDTILFPGAKLCKVCGLPFAPAARNQQICYRRHQFTCLVCGKPYELKGRNSRPSRIRKTCSAKCQYELSKDTRLKRYGMATCVWEDTAEKRLATYYQNRELKESSNSKETVLCNPPEDDVKESCDSPKSKNSPNKKIKKSNLRKRLKKLLSRGIIPANLSDEELKIWITENDPNLLNLLNTAQSEKSTEDESEELESSEELLESESAETEDSTDSKYAPEYLEGLQSLTDFLSRQLQKAEECVHNMKRTLEGPVFELLRDSTSKTTTVEVPKIIEVPRQQKKLKKIYPKLNFGSGKERQEFYSLALNDVLARLDEYIPEEFLSTEEHVVISRTKLCEFCHVPYVAKIASGTVCYNKHIFRCNVCGKPFEELTLSYDSKTYKKKLNLFCSTECKRKAEQGKEYKLICLGSYNT